MDTVGLPRKPAMELRPLTPHDRFESKTVLTHFSNRQKSTQYTARAHLMLYLFISP